MLVSTAPIEIPFVEECKIQYSDFSSLPVIASTHITSDAGKSMKDEICFTAEYFLG